MPRKNEEQTNPKAPLGTATLLPRRAAEFLQSAAASKGPAAGVNAAPASYR